MAFGTPILFSHIGSVIELERAPAVELGATNRRSDAACGLPRRELPPTGLPRSFSGLAPPSPLQEVAAEQQSGGAEQQSRVAEIEERANDLVTQGASASTSSHPTGRRGAGP